MLSGNITRRLYLICVLFFTSSSLMLASPINWLLLGRFADGGALNGTFVVDYNPANPTSLAANDIIDFNLTVSGGNTAIFNSFTYNTTNTVLRPDGIYEPTQSPCYGFYIPNAPPPGPDRVLGFCLQQRPTQVGPGSLFISFRNGPSEFKERSPDEFFAYDDYRGGAGGYIVRSFATPEPASFFFILSGLLGICCLKWFRFRVTRITATPAAGRNRIITCGKDF